MNKEQISAEFDAFFEFPTSDKSKVSSVSCKLFAMIMVEMALSKSEPAQVSQPVDSIRNYPEFVTDILRLSDASVSKDTKQQIRKSIYDTIDSRVANAAPKKYQELRREYEELNHLNYVLQSELLDSDTSLKSVEKSLDGLGYFGTYAEQIESLKLSLAALEKEIKLIDDYSK